MTDNISFYKDAIPAKRGKKLGVNMLDFLLATILSVLFYALTNLVTEALPNIKETQNEIALVQNEMKAMIKESKIGEEKDGSFLGTDTLSKNYVYRLTYASLLKGGVEEKNISSSISNVYSPITSDTDNAYFYYVTFKETNLEGFSEKGIHGFSSYHELLSKEMPFSFLIEDNYPYLPLENAQQIQNYIIDENYEIGGVTYNALKGRYDSLLKDGVNDFQDNYLPYKQKANVNEQYKNKIYTVRRIEVLIAYVLSSFIAYFLFPLLLKDGKTLAMKVTSLGYCSEEGKRPKWQNLLIRSSLLFVEESFIMTLLPFLVYGGNAIDMVYLPFLGDISLLWVGAFSLLFMLFSFLSTFIDKEKKSTFSELLSHLILKDGKEFVLSKNGEGNESKRK